MSLYGRPKLWRHGERALNNETRNSKLCFKDGCDVYSHTRCCGFPPNNVCPFEHAVCRKHQALLWQTHPTADYYLLPRERCEACASTAVRRAMRYHLMLNKKDERRKRTFQGLCALGAITVLAYTGLTYKQQGASELYRQIWEVSKVLAVGAGAMMLGGICVFVPLLVKMWHDDIDHPSPKPAYASDIEET